MTDIFCTLYPKWLAEGSIIYENKAAYAILSVTPATPGHAIVIAKKHVERLEQLRGSDLEQFVDAIPATAQSIRGIYESSPKKIADFYETLKKIPPTVQSRNLAQKMLNHRHLLVQPDAAYNVGINVGGYAGQVVNHLHAQLFPRRERGLGIVTAMQLLFDGDQ